MEEQGPSNKDQNEEKTYMENEAKKVRVYINELRSRLAKLQDEGEEIERSTGNILGDQIPHLNDLDTTASADSPSESHRALPPPMGATISESTGFTSLLRKFENMKNVSSRPDVIREDPEEIRKLRQQNGSIREKIKQIQLRIEKAQSGNKSYSDRNPSMETIAEAETCNQLYEAAANTLKKINAIEAEITSVESLFKTRQKELPLECTKDKKMRTMKY